MQELEEGRGTAPVKNQGIRPLALMPLILQKKYSGKQSQSHSVSPLKIKRTRNPFIGFKKAESICSVRSKNSNLDSTAEFSNLLKPNQTEVKEEHRESEDEVFSSTESSVEAESGAEPSNLQDFEENQESENELKSEVEGRSGSMQTSKTPTSASSEYFMNIRRPFFDELTKNEKIPEIYFGQEIVNKDLKGALPFHKFTAIEDQGSSVRFLRSTSKFLYLEDNYINQLSVPLGFCIQPFAKMGPEDSPVQKILLKNEKNENLIFDEIRCQEKNCGGIPFHHDRLREDGSTKGIKCEFCGRYRKIGDFRDILEKANSEMIGTFDVVYDGADDVSGVKNGLYGADQGSQFDGKRVVFIFELGPNTVDFSAMEEFKKVLKAVFSTLVTLKSAQDGEKTIYENIDFLTVFFICFQNHLFVVDVDTFIRTGMIRITDVWDYALDIAVVEETLEIIPSGIFTKKTKNRKNRLKLAFNNHSNTLKDLTEAQIEPLIAQLTHQESPLIQKKKIKGFSGSNCLLNAVEIAADMLSDTPNSHIIQFTSSFTPEYFINKTEKLGLMDHTTKQNELAEALIAQSTLIDVFCLRESSLSTFANLSLRTGGQAVFLPDFVSNCNSEDEVRQNLEFLVAGEVYYGVEVKAVLHKDVFGVKWLVPLDLGFTGRVVKLSGMRSLSDLSVVFDAERIKIKTGDFRLKSQFQVNYTTRQGKRCTRVLNYTHKISETPTKLYETLDPFTTFLLLARTSLFENHEKRPESRSNALTRAFKDILIAYNSSIEEVDDLGCEILDQAIFDDLVIPATLETCLVLLFALKTKPIFHRKIGFSGGWIFDQLLSVFNDGWLNCVSFVYPRVYRVEDLVRAESGRWRTQCMILSKEDVLDGLYLADYGRYLMLVGFERKDGVLNWRVYGSRRLNKDHLKALEPFITDLGKEREIQPIFLEKSDGEKYQFWIQDLLLEDGDATNLTLEGFREALEKQINT